MSREDDLREELELLLQAALDVLWHSELRCDCLAPDLEIGCPRCYLENRAEGAAHLLGLPKEGV